MVWNRSKNSRSTCSECRRQANSLHRLVATPASSWVEGSRSCRQHLIQLIDDIIHSITKQLIHPPHTPLGIEGRHVEIIPCEVKGIDNMVADHPQPLHLLVSEFLSRA